MLERACSKANEKKFLTSLEHIPSRVSKWVLCETTPKPLSPVAGRQRRDRESAARQLGRNENCAAQSAVPLPSLWLRKVVWYMKIALGHFSVAGKPTSSD